MGKISSILHLSYENRLKHVADFRVSYRFFTPEEGGRTHLPFQGLRCDFMYNNRVYMIWPEFEDNAGNIITQNNIAVPISGTARMWIIIPERRLLHRNNIHVGLKCFFCEGKETAECEVIEILGLMNNPIQ